MSAKKKTGKKIIIIVSSVAAVILLIVVASVLIKKALSKVASMNSYANVIEVDYHDLSEAISLSGTVQGISSTNVTSKAAAEIRSVGVSVGDQVKEGDVLCILDDAAIKEQIAETELLIRNQTAISDMGSQQNKQALQNAKDDREAQLKEAQAAIDDAVNEYDKQNAKLAEYRKDLNDKKQALQNAKDMAGRAKAALEAYTGTDTEVLASLVQTYEKAEIACQQAQATADALQAQVEAQEEVVKQCSKAVANANAMYASTETSADRMVEAAQQTVNMEAYQTSDSSAKSALKTLQEQLADCTVYAPCDGVVTAVNIKMGDNNIPGTVLVTIEDTSAMKITASVDEADILRVQENMNAVVTATALGEERVNGTVTRVVRVKNSSGGYMEGAASAAGYAVDITIEKSDLLVGMTAKAKIILKEKKDILSVPYDLVYEDDNGQKYVLIAVENQDDSAMCTAVRRNVTVGEEVDYFMEITGGDLKAGDKIISNAGITEGQTFMINRYMDMEGES